MLDGKKVLLEFRDPDGSENLTRPRRLRNQGEESGDAESQPFFFGEKGIFDFFALIKFGDLSLLLSSKKN